MADEAVGDAAAAVAEGGGAVVLIPNPEAEASEHNGMVPEVPDYAGRVASHDIRLAELEQRIQLCEESHRVLQGDLDGRAYTAHDHPVDEDVRILADELRALREEEVAPRRGRLPQRGWLKRWLRGQDA